MRFYTDGSYNKKKYPDYYGWAFTALDESDNEIDHRSGADNKHLESYQIGGECRAALEVLQYCLENEIYEVDIYHDYAGVRHWAMLEWKTNKPVSRDYMLKFLELQSKLFDQAIAQGLKHYVTFHKVKGHSGILGNELADKYASAAVIAKYSE